MAKIKAGTYTVSELLQRAGVDLHEKAGAEYLDGAPDMRRVKIGGLAFDSTEDVIKVPVTASEVEVTVDGKVDTVLDVELDEDQQKEADASFRDAADADGPTRRSSKGGRKSASDES
jgi:hypothetical protein